MNSGSSLRLTIPKPPLAAERGMPLPELGLCADIADGASSDEASSAAATLDANSRFSARRKARTKSTCRHSASNAASGLSVAAVGVLFAAWVTGSTAAVSLPSAQL